MERYAYDATTGKFTGKINCQIDPVASKKAGKDIFIIPRHTTPVKPLPAKEDHDVIWKNGNWEYVCTKAESSTEEYIPTAKEKKQQELFEVESKLRDSDYVALKLAEATAVGDGDIVDALLEKYEEILQNRAEWRERVSSLREEITTME